MSDNARTNDFDKYKNIPIDQDDETFKGLPMVDVSFYWRMLFYCEIGASCVSLIQILIATYAFNTKMETCVDYLVVPFTIINLLVNTVIFTSSHIARWSRPGAICAGDYLEEDDFNKVRYMLDDIIEGEEIEIDITNANMYLIK